MDLMRKEREDKDIARLLGIRLKQEGCEADCVLDSVEMRDLCKGRSLPGVKMMILAFMRGWEVQHELQVTFGKRGSVRFGTQAEAEKYLMALPVNYAGATRKQEDGKWLVSYHRIAALRTKLEVA